ncbi:MAG: response regulator transcription factor [Oscillospiraceae bacterium]
MYKIFVVEDDEAIAKLLQENLNKWGFEAVCCCDFSKVTQEFESAAPHLVLLDISLPFYNGYYWCAEMRKITDTPIIFLSSHSEDMDIVMAMNMGGDDYITKPFAVDVLIAKINAIVRRAYSYKGERAFLTAGDATLNPGDGTLCVKGKSVDLTKNELRILKALMSQKNNIVSREVIMKALWDSDSFIDDNTLTVNINRLRAKMADAGLEDFISTKKGLGYCVYD